MDSLKITIVTVVYNDVNNIEKTIKSVIEQTYNNIEYIIIDGASNDGTIEVIKQFASNITKWISESDNGIYDAMNKGINMATGKYINFMNSGDLFYDKNVLFNIFNNARYDEEIIWGDTVGNFNNIKLLQQNVPFYKSKSYCSKVGICHQSVFVPTIHAKEYPFNIVFKICADHQMLHFLHNKGIIFTQKDLIVSEITCEKGFSDKHFYLKMKERGEIYGISKTFKFHIYLYFNIIKEMIRKLLKKIEPRYIKKYRFENKLNKVDI